MAEPIPFPGSRRAMAARDLVAKAEAIRADNLRAIKADDRRIIEGEVEYVELRSSRHVVIGAMPSARALVNRARLRGLGLSASVAIAARFLRFNAIALTLGFATGVLAVLVPALVIAWVVS